MVILFVTLLMLACIFLGLIVLIQNPKGGGLAGNVAGFSNQFMGVKQTTDVLEKGTWTLAIVVGALCLFSALFIPKATATQVRDVRPQTTNSQQQAPTTPLQTQPKAK